MKTKTRTIAACVLLCVTLGACDSQEEKHQKYLNRGNQLYEQGDYKKARLEYKNAARIKPADADVRYRFGLLDESEGDIRSAFGHFLAAEQQDAHYRPALTKLAQYFLAAEQYDECQKRLNTILQDTPDDPDGHALRAALHLRHKEFAETEAQARLALGKDPKNVTAFTVLTGLYVAQGDQDKAAATVEQAIAQNPQSVPLLLLKAMVYERSANLQKIAEAYKVIFHLKPAEVRFRDELSKVYLQAEQKDEAEKILREGVAAMPDNWEMKQRLVAFLNANRGMDEAEKTIKAYMAANPDRGEINFWLADLYIANKATDRAVALLEQLVQKNKDDVQDKSSLTARTSLARIHFDQGEKQLAEKLANAVLDSAPNNREALFVRAQMLFDQGEYEQAVSALRTIVRDNPKASDALHLLGETLLIQGHLDLAIDTFSQLVDVNPAHMPAKVRLAQIYALRGDTPKALQLLTLVTKMDPSFPVGWESLARVALGAQNREQAETAIKTLEGLAGQERTAQFLRGQLAAATGAQEEAMASYRKVIEADPSSPLAEHALSAYADSAFKTGKLEEAVLYFKGLNVENAYIATLAGDCSLRLGKKEEAAISYDKAIALNAPQADPYIARARLYAADGKTDQALALLDKVSASSRADMRVMVIRADLLIAAKRNREAVTVYEALLARNPGLDLAANNMAQLIADTMYTDPQLLEKARVVAERFIRSTNPYYLDTLGWVYYRLGQNQQAQAILERVVAFDQKLPQQVFYHYGATLLKAGQTVQAKEQLKKATEGADPYIGLDEAKSLLQGI